MQAFHQITLILLLQKSFIYLAEPSLINDKIRFKIFSKLHDYNLTDQKAHTRSIFDLRDKRYCPIAL